MSYIISVEGVKHGDEKQLQVSSASFFAFYIEAD